MHTIESVNMVPITAGLLSFHLVVETGASAFRLSGIATWPGRRMDIGHT